MDWKAILKIDGFKAVVMMIFALIPYVKNVSDAGYEGVMGFPFQSIDLWLNRYVELNHGIAGDYLLFRPELFLLNIIIGYVVAVLIAGIYVTLKNYTIVEKK